MWYAPHQQQQVSDNSMDLTIDEINVNEEDHRTPPFDVIVTPQQSTVLLIHDDDVRALQHLPSSSEMHIDNNDTLTPIVDDGYSINQFQSSDMMNSGVATNTSPAKVKRLPQQFACIDLGSVKFPDVQPFTATDIKVSTCCVVDKYNYSYVRVCISHVARFRIFYSIAHYHQLLYVCAICICM
jgi:hypothetical protein